MFLKNFLRFCPLPGTQFEKNDINAANSLIFFSGATPSDQFRTGTQSNLPLQNILALLVFDTWSVALLIVFLVKNIID